MAIKDESQGQIDGMRQADAGGYPYFLRGESVIEELQRRLRIKEIQAVMNLAGKVKSEA